MEKDAHYTLIGIFVTVTLVALFGFFIWLASPRDDKNSDFYTVYYTDPINGLAEGASVTYRGMTVGKVQNIRLDPDRVDLIKVDIAVDKITPVRSHTKAALDTQGVTGLIHIELLTAPDDKNPPERLANEKYPVLKGTPSEITKILSKVSKFTNEGSEAAESLHELSDQLRAHPSQLIFGKHDGNQDKAKKP